MKAIRKYLYTAFLLFWGNGLVLGQDVQRIIVDDPHRSKIIPDKVFEIGLPVLLIVFILSTIAGIFKHRTESRLKEKAIDKGLSESTLVQLFSIDQELNRMVYIKWFLVLTALSLAFVIIYLLNRAAIQSAYLALAVIAFCLGLSSLAYYRVSRRK